MRTQKSNYMASDGSMNKLLVLGVVLSLCIVVYVVLRIFSLLYPSTTSTEAKNTIVYSHSTLHIADTTYTLQGYPDRIKIHGDYLLIIQPMKDLTTIYRRSTQKKVLQQNKVIIDYDGKNTLSYTNDRTTYFNNQSLHMSCMDGYIGSEDKVLCIVPKTNDNLDNKLVEIDPNSQFSKDVYSSSYTLNSISVINGVMYLGGYTLADQKPVLIVDGKAYPIQDRADVVYEIDNKIYFASFPSTINNNTESFTKINIPKKEKQGTITKPVEKRRIVF